MTFLLLHPIYHLVFPQNGFKTKTWIYERASSPRQTPSAKGWEHWYWGSLTLLPLPILPATKPNSSTATLLSSQRKKKKSHVPCLKGSQTWSQLLAKKNPFVTFTSQKNQSNFDTWLIFMASKLLTKLSNNVAGLFSFLSSLALRAMGRASTPSGESREPPPLVHQMKKAKFSPLLLPGGLTPSFLPWAWQLLTAVALQMTFWRPALARKEPAQVQDSRARGQDEPPAPFWHLACVWYAEPLMQHTATISEPRIC